MGILLQNPAVRIFEEYKRFKYEKSGSQLNLDEYLNTSLVKNNAIVRSILCKPLGQITNDDMKNVKKILDEKFFHVDLFRNYAQSIKIIEDSFKLKLETSRSKKYSRCIQDHFTAIAQRKSDVLDSDFNDNILSIFKSNIFDFSIYPH